MAKTIQKEIDTITHDDAQRTNIPTAELQNVMRKEDMKPIPLSYEKRNPDLDPQLIWRGKYDGDDTLTVQAPPLYIQENVHPKALINDLIETSKKTPGSQVQINMFSDFNGYPEGANKTDFYQHDHNWTNRMILGDSLQVMASLAEREGLRGKVQCIYMDPPYGIKFNSNFQWSTTSRDVKDGKLDNMTREPEQVKAFRDTWRDGIHSYLSYLRDRFILARDLLSDSGSIFVQIGDENIHKVRIILDEIFGEVNHVSQISYATTSGFSTLYLSSIFNYTLWYAKNISKLKYHKLYYKRNENSPGSQTYKRVSSFSFLDNSPLDRNRLVTSDQLTSQGRSSTQNDPFICHNKNFYPPLGLHWKTRIDGLYRLYKSERIMLGTKFPRYLRFFDDFAAIEYSNLWDDTTGGFDDKLYIVQTNSKVIQRCILMSTDPGDLVLDPTCGSGTTAYVAEQWGRRWITIDTSRVALALARMRLMGARYPWYLMKDSKEGQEKEAKLSDIPPSGDPTYNNINLGFVYERVPHITLKSIANNADIDVIYDKWQKVIDPIREELNNELKKKWEEWEVPRDIPKDPHWSPKAIDLLGEWWKKKNQSDLTALNKELNQRWTERDVPKEVPNDPAWTPKAIELHKKWWEGRINRQKEIDESIADHADYEFLYDKPYEKKNVVRVAGPFTVESLSPHRVLGLDENDELIDPASTKTGEDGKDFESMILDNLKESGVQQSHKEDKIEFTGINPWAGSMICAEGTYLEGETEKRAAIFIGPEFGTVGRQDLVQATREAADFGFDVLISCAFNYDAQSTEFTNLGRIHVIKARMNADLHMGKELKNNGKGNLFVVFGEPDIVINYLKDKNGDDTGKISVRIRGVDVFYPNTGEIRSDNADGIACWFIDTNYNDETFFVRQAYFLGANNPYELLKKTLKNEINEDVWDGIHSDTSRVFDKPTTGKIAVKVINHLGDEVMKVFKIV